MVAIKAKELELRYQQKQFKSSQPKILNLFIYFFTQQYFKMSVFDWTEFW